MSTLGVQEAAALLHVHAQTVLELAQSGELPGARIGRSWVFIEADVLEWLRLQIQRQRAQRLSEKVEKAPPDPRIKRPRGRPRKSTALPELIGELAPAQVGVDEQHVRV